MKLSKILLIVFMAVLLSASVAALGVTPGRTTITFEPDSEQTLGFDILNDQHKNVKVKLAIEGDAKGAAIKLVQDEIEFGEEEERKHVEYRLKLPKAFDTPGTKEIRISITEMPDEKTDRPLQVNAKVGVITQLRIKVPSEGKYITVEGMEISEGSSGEYVTFLVPVSSLGTEEISRLSGEIEIEGPDGKKVASVLTQEEALKAGKRTMLKAVWKADVLPGKYKAKVAIKYDGENAKTEKEFNVGKVSIEIVSIYTKNFQLGGIAKMDVKLKSNWNELLEVFGELFIKSVSLDPIASVKTATAELEPGQENVISAYWDTSGVEEGKYYITLKVNYGGGNYIEKQFESVLTLNSMSFAPMGTTGQVVAGKSSNKGLMAVIIIILVISNIVWFIRAKRRKK